MPRLAEWYSRVNNKGGMTKPVPAGIRKTINYAIVGLLVLIALLKLIYVNYTPLVEAYIHNGAEARAVEWVKENQPEGRMFSSYNWGGYLIWNLPEYPVFIDGRTDLFGDEMIGEWIEIVNAEEGWQQKLNHWQVRLILLEPDRPIVKELGKNGWTLYYSDDGAVVYGR